MSSRWDFIDSAMQMMSASEPAKPEKETFPMREFAVLPAVVTAQELAFEDGSVLRVELERPGRVHVVIAKDGDDIQAQSLHRTRQDALDRVECEMQGERSERAERVQ